MKASVIIPDSQLLCEKDAAKWLGFSHRTLQKWRQNGQGPRFIKLTPRAIRYPLDGLKEFIALKGLTSTSEYGNG